MLKRLIGVAACIGMLSAATPAAAIDVLPGDYTILPSGTNGALLYGQYATSNKLKVDGIGNIPKSKLGLAIGIVRFLHYSDINGIPVGIQAFIPFGGFTDANIGGGPQTKKNGLGDMTLGATVWPIKTTGDFGTTIGFTTFLTVPTGAYSGHPDTLSLGSGTWTVTPQIGLIQKIGQKVSFDAAFDAGFSADHTEDGLKRSRTASEQFQAYLRYKVTDATVVSFGYSGTFGGRSSIAGIYTGTKTREDQLRLVASHFFTPSVQLMGVVATDVHASGGFKQDFVGTLRLLVLY